MINPNAGEASDKMQQVVDSLRTNNDLAVVGGYIRDGLQENNWPYQHGVWTRTLEVFAHPTQPIYKASALNSFMSKTLQAMDPLQADHVVQFSGGARGDQYLHLGSLSFDDWIGQANLRADVHLSENLGPVKNGGMATQWVASRTIDLLQRTRVRLFPDEGHSYEAAAAAASGASITAIERKRLGESVGRRAIAGLLEPPVLSAVASGRRFNV